MGGSYGYFLSKYDWTEHKFEQAVRWGYMFIEEGDDFGFALLCTRTCRGIVLNK